MLYTLISQRKNQYFFTCKKFLLAQQRRRISRSAVLRNVRVRFAPSPTGFLHIGGLRTALLNYLFAKSKGGKFIVRIEDTDQSRLVPGAVENLLKQLKWIGIIPDEGPTVGGEYGPYVQSERLKIYKKYSQRLLENGSAYRCFCSQRRLDIMRRDQLRRKEHSKYDNRCRHLSESEIQKKLDVGEPYVLRLKLNDGPRSFNDIIFGSAITQDLATIEGDPVIYKSDGFPTYHLANVIDDHLMKITHILRGKEWLNSTVKHVTLYEAFGWTPPHFAHLPLLLNEDGKKLSKRQGDVYVEQYREKGYHPAALLNFMIHHGAGYPDDMGTVFGDKMASSQSAIEEFSQKFSLEKVGGTDSVIQFRKLDDYNSEILKHLLTSEEGKMYLVKELKHLVCEKYGKESLLDDMKSDSVRRDYIARVLSIRQTHINTLACLVSDEYGYVWMRPNIKADIVDDNLRAFVLAFLSVLEGFDNLAYAKEVTDFHNSRLRSIVKESGLKIAPAMATLRELLMGRKQGPGVTEIMHIIGKEETLARLRKVHSQTKEPISSGINKR